MEVFGIWESDKDDINDIQGGSLLVEASDDDLWGKIKKKNFGERRTN